MRQAIFPAMALALPLVLGACVSQPLVTASEEVSRLQSMGYVVSARSKSGATKVLHYSGPINASVVCGQGRNMTTMARQTQSSDGSIQEYQLRAYLILASRTDGKISAAGRDGIYAVSKVTRPRGKRAASQIETIEFAPGESGTFSTGLSCKAG